MKIRFGSASHQSWFFVVSSSTALSVLAAAAWGQEPPPYWSAPVSEMTSGLAPLSAAAGRQMVAVPAGHYRIGRDSGPRSERPQHEVRLAAFRIDRTEVTNAQYAEFLNALRLPVRGSFDVGAISRRNGDARTIARLGDFDERGSYPIIELDDNEARILLRDGKFEPAGGHANRPVTETTWAGARAYCVWRGGDLPTEVQWEAAARGPDDRMYPWGDTEPTDRLAFTSGRTGLTADIGSLSAGASPFGVLDMAGSLAEWTKSLKRPYPYNSGDGREDIHAAGERTTRGGDYVYDRAKSKLAVSFRDGYSNAPFDGHRHIGFRCVSNPPLSGSPSP